MSGGGEGRIVVLKSEWDDAKRIKAERDALWAALLSIARPDAETLLWPWDARYYRAQSIARNALSATVKRGPE